MKVRAMSLVSSHDEKPIFLSPLLSNAELGLVLIPTGETRLGINALYNCVYYYPTQLIGSSWRLGVSRGLVSAPQPPPPTHNELMFSPTEDKVKNVRPREERLLCCNDEQVKQTLVQFNPLVN